MKACVVVLILVALAAGAELKPQVTIHNVRVEEVKAAIVAEFVAHGLTLGSDSQYQTTFTKEFGLRDMLVNDTCRGCTDKYAVTFTFVPQGDDVLVMLAETIQSQNVFGAVTSRPAEDRKGKEWAAMQTILKRLKMQLEARATSSANRQIPDTKPATPAAKDLGEPFARAGLKALVAIANGGAEASAKPKGALSDAETAAGTPEEKAVLASLQQYAADRKSQQAGESKCLQELIHVLQERNSKMDSGACAKRVAVN